MNFEINNVHILFYVFKNSEKEMTMMLDYEFTLDPRFNQNILQVQNNMNYLFANPNNKDNPLLNLKLPFKNIDNTMSFPIVPISSSQFQSKLKKN